MAGAKSNWLTEEMRLYVWGLMIHKGREIRCDKCGSYNHLELHHDHYEYPTFYDLRVRCDKCHRNVRDHKKHISTVATVFENGKRYLVSNKFKIQY